MFSFKQFIAESAPSSKFNGMSENLYNFLEHLSSPTDPHHIYAHTMHEEVLSEEERKRDYLKFDPEAVAPAMNMPKTRALIDKAREDIPQGQNIHKRIHQGLRATNDALQNETPEESKRKLGESYAVLADFMRSRGYKGVKPNLLGGNQKTEKSTGEGVMTKGISMAPHATSGLHNFDICPKASNECRENCLGLTADGNKRYPDSSLAGKVWRTHFLAKHPEHFARILDHEVGKHKEEAQKEGMKPGVRLNITSDLAWEKHMPHLFERHPEVQFYDYTKMHNRVGRRDLPANYHLALSHTGSGHEESNDQHAADALSRGQVVAMVHQAGKGIPTPTHVEDVKSGRRYPIVNGDNDDNTFDRHDQAGAFQGGQGQGVVSGLALKGVSKERAGNFANKVDSDGIIRINR